MFVARFLAPSAHGALWSTGYKVHQCKGITVKINRNAEFRYTAHNYAIASNYITGISGTQQAELRANFISTARNAYCAQLE